MAQALKTTLHPLHDRILIQRIEEKEVRRGGLICCGAVDEPREQVLDVVVMEMELRGEGRPMHHGGHGAVLSLYLSEHR